MKIKCVLADPILDNPLVQGQVYDIHPVRDIAWNVHGCMYMIDGKFWDGQRFEIVTNFLSDNALLASVIENTERNAD